MKLMGVKSIICSLMKSPASISEPSGRRTVLVIQFFLFLFLFDLSTPRIFSPLSTIVITLSFNHPLIRRHPWYFWYQPVPFSVPQPIPTKHPNPFNINKQSLINGQFVSHFTAKNNEHNIHSGIIYQHSGSCWKMAGPGSSSQPDLRDPSIVVPEIHVRLLSSLGSSWIIKDLRFRSRQVGCFFCLSMMI